MHPQGRFNRLRPLLERRPAPIGRHASTSIVQRSQDCSLRYDKFPYPLAGIFGTVEVRDDVWTLPRRSARRERHGPHHLPRSTDAGRRRGASSTLSFHGENVPIDEELRNALSPGSQRLVERHEAARPAAARQRSALSHAREAAQRAGSAASRSTTPSSIEPTYFPYRLEKLHGTFTFADGRLQMDQLQAEHGRTQISALGRMPASIRKAAGGCSSNGCSSIACRSIATCSTPCPRRSRSRPPSLEPTGTFNLRGDLALAGGARPGQPLGADWNVTIDCHNNALQCGVPLSRHPRLAVARRHERRRAASNRPANCNSIASLRRLPNHRSARPDLDRQRTGAARLLGRSSSRANARATPHRQALRRLDRRRRLGRARRRARVRLPRHAHAGRPRPLRAGTHARRRQAQRARCLATVDLRGKGKTSQQRRQVAAASNFATPTSTNSPRWSRC